MEVDGGCEREVVKTGASPGVDAKLPKPSTQVGFSSGTSVSPFRESDGVRWVTGAKRV